MIEENSTRYSYIVSKTSIKLEIKARFPSDIRTNKLKIKNINYESITLAVCT